MTRIFDIDDNEIQEEDVDLELGYLTPDRKFKEHHDAIEGQDRQFHYTVKAFYFDDGTSYKPTSESDPRIIIDDAQKGLFRYNPAKGEVKKLRGIDLDEIEDAPAIAAQEAWDEYEDIQRYTLYTEEEIAEREAQKQREAEEAEKEAARQQFLDEGPARLESAETSIEETNVTVEDLILTMADLIGGEEAE